MRVDQFDYHLPEELIAQEPVEPRDASRLLVLHRQTGLMEHRHVRDLPGYLSHEDCLIFNDTRVIPARLLGHKPTGGKAEVFLLEPLQGVRLWRALVRPASRLGPGRRVYLRGGLVAEVIETYEAGEALVSVAPNGAGECTDEELRRLLAVAGEIPLPPYIKKPLLDSERYQTIYAREEGSVAAPTAGLHFTPTLLAALERLGVKIGYVTLHIGLDTFRSVTAENVQDHRIHTEYCRVPQATAELVRVTKHRGGRVFAVGTTVVRAIESAAQSGSCSSWEGRTNLFIYPGYRFRVVDGLLTNFHLPRSTLLMLVSAFADQVTGKSGLSGHRLILSAYREAIRLRYRFYSFGDAMLIL